MIYIYLDDIRGTPSGYIHTKSVNETRHLIENLNNSGYDDFTLDLDHDLGDYADDGGDGYKLVLWLIETERNNSHYIVKCHSANSVGKEHIEGLVERYWEGE